MNTYRIFSGSSYKIFIKNSDLSVPNNLEEFMERHKNEQNTLHSTIFNIKTKDSQISQRKSIKSFNQSQPRYMKKAKRHKEEKSKNLINVQKVTFENPT